MQPYNLIKAKGNNSIQVAYLLKEHTSDVEGLIVDNNAPIHNLPRSDEESCRHFPEIYTKNWFFQHRNLMAGNAGRRKLPVEFGSKTPDYQTIAFRTEGKAQKGSISLWNQ